jgi:acetate kinase
VKQEKPYVLAVNGGSSSIKFAVYKMIDWPQQGLHGKVDRIGLRGTTLTFEDLEGNRHDNRIIGDFDQRSAANFLIDWLDHQIGVTSIKAVGHRVVNGGAHSSDPQRVTQKLLNALRHISTYAPEHLPSEIAMIDLFCERFPGLPQVACFDTAFHRDMPQVARILPIPRRFQVLGVERYGFHGLSYSFLMQELARVDGNKVANGRVILAHLGNGASLAAVRGGKCIDTSMGFTPAAGVPMSTRSGDLDPGLVWYLAQTEHMSAEQFHHMVNHESGLLGVSETSSDLRDLLACEAEDVRAAEAIALFCYQVKKCIGAFAASLGGLDTLIFSGGIGENAALIRSRICNGLGFLGIEIEEKCNVANVGVISTKTSRIAVRVMHTDEEVMIAKSVCHLLGLVIEKENQHGYKQEKV